jgi:hypothetical protein
MDIITVVILLIIILLFYLLTKKEHYADNYSILVPEIINTSPSFDYPNQYGEVTNPYAQAKTSSQNNLFNQLHQIYL